MALSPNTTYGPLSTVRTKFWVLGIAQEKPKKSINEISNYKTFAQERKLLLKQKLLSTEKNIHLSSDKKLILKVI